MDQAADKNMKYKSEIRKKFISDLFKQQRERLMESEKLETLGLKRQQPPPTLDALLFCIKSASVKGLYDSISAHGSFTHSVPINMYEPIMALILTPESLQTNEGLLLLSLAIQHCCCQNNESPQRQSMLDIIKAYSVVEKIYALTLESFQVNNANRTRLLLHCLKSFGLGRVERVRDNQLLGVYLNKLMSVAIQEPSLLVLMSFISEQTIFENWVYSKVSKIAFAKENIKKLTCCNILLNFCILSEDEEQIFTLFPEILKALQNLYVTNPENHYRYKVKILSSLAQLISKYPYNRSEELLAEVFKSKLQELLILILHVSGINVQIYVFEIQGALIDRITQIGERFFQMFPQQILIKVILGMESSHMNIITQSLQSTTKIVEYAPRNFLFELERDYEIACVTQNLAYHQNEFISAAAASLYETFKVIKQSLEQQGSLDNENEMM